MVTRNIYFYPHTKLRDRQLDTIFKWPDDEVINKNDFCGKSGSQVSKSYAHAAKLKISWKQQLPLLNIKMRPKRAPRDAIVYVWGGLILSGKFILDLDNPWALVGYNLPAMRIYKKVIKRILLSNRCIEIRCMSEACRNSLEVLFGRAVYNKATVVYPLMPQRIKAVPAKKTKNCNFLFIGTQFEIKGGECLIKAFKRLYATDNSVRLDLITHLPSHFTADVTECPGIYLHEARIKREEIYSRFMARADVLVLPTFVESFGMVALEALAHGLALIVTDVYALREIVINNQNGKLLDPPISVWDGVVPSIFHYDLPNIKDHINKIDKAHFEVLLFEAMREYALDANKLIAARSKSIEIMNKKFLC